MNVLVLGGAGFIGTALGARYAQLGHRVTVIDSLELGQSFTAGGPWVWARIQDINIEPYVEEADLVYHLASSVGVAHIDSNPQAALFNNTEMTHKLIPLFEKYQKKVIFASTSEVYGEGPFKETDHASIGPPTTLRWGYAASKLMTEFMIVASTFPYTIVRFFNVTGPNHSVASGMVLPRFVAQAQASAPLTVYGGGSQVRSFCHIDDAVDGLLILADHDEDGIFNIGHEQPITMYDLADHVIRLTGSDSTIEMIPHKKVFSEHHGDISHRVPDITKMRALGFAPTKTLDNIIHDMMES